MKRAHEEIRLGIKPAGLQAGNSKRQKLQSKPIEVVNKSEESDNESMSFSEDLGNSNESISFSGDSDNSNELIEI